MSLLIPNSLTLSIFQQKFSLSYRFIKVLWLVLKFLCLKDIYWIIWHFLWKYCFRLFTYSVQVSHLLDTFFKVWRVFISKLELAWCCCGRNCNRHTSNTGLKLFLINILEIKIVWLLKDFTSFRGISTW
jgi:hypothetical protein